jgi:periplasmic divalent cation tolerance protein
VSRERRVSENCRLETSRAQEAASERDERDIMTDKIIVLVTCGSRKEARRIAQSLVEAKLAACVNTLQTPVESIYRWEGKVETAREFLLVIKSSRKRFAALQAEVRRLHSYSVPEIIALPIAKGSRAYLTWIADSVKPAMRQAHRQA